MMSYLTEAQWCIYGSVNKVIIGSDYSTKPLSEPMVVYYPFDPWEQISVKFELKKKSLTMNESENVVSKMATIFFISALMC